jgi:UDP-glucose 4-epimerase
MQITGKRILITGGAGFIGSELVRQAVRAGACVTVIDNLVNGRQENLADLGGSIEFLRIDIRDREAVERAMRGAEVVFHLACMGVRHSIHAPRENHEVNAEGTLNLLLAARQAGAERFVYISSSEVYGTARSVPMPEEHPTYPKTVYGASKLAGECYTRAFHDTYGFPTVVIRPFNTYGPRCHHEGDSGEVIPKFLLRAMARRPMMIFGDGTQTRDFTYVSDTAAGILAAGSCDDAVGETVNLGSGFEISINDLAAQVRSALELPDAIVEHVEPRPGDVLRLFADVSKARRLFGYAPAVTFGNGLALLREWYRAQDTPPEVLLENEIVRNWKIGDARTHA